jgi:hypothetical protein
MCGMPIALLNANTVPGNPESYAIAITSPQHRSIINQRPHSISPNPTQLDQPPPPVSKNNHRLFRSASAFLNGHPLVLLSAPVRRLTRFFLSPANSSTHSPNVASTLLPRHPSR